MHRRAPSSTYILLALHCVVGCSSGSTPNGVRSLDVGGGGGTESPGGGAQGTGAAPAQTGGAGAFGSGGAAAGGAAAGGAASGGATVGGAAAGGGSSGGGAGIGGGNPAGGSDGNPAGGGDGMLPTEGPTASEAAAAMGPGVNLGQMFESTQHPRTLEAATAKIDAYYARGFRNLRIPITWTEAVGGDFLVTDPTVGAVDRSHPRLQVIESVVDYALSKPDFYVVINAHHEVTLKTESRALVLERLWKDIAQIFGSKDHRLLFEILNEPHRGDDSAMPAADLRNMVGLAYQQIRSVDPSRIVLFGGNQWFGAHEVPAVWTSVEEIGGGEDPYVMATFHHYDPWTFCGDNQDTYDDPWTEENQSGPMDQMANWASTVGGGMPVYIGEWGVGWGSRYSAMECNNIRSWYTTFDSVHAASHGQPTAVWDDGGWFMIFDHASNDYDNNLIDCILGTCDWDGTERFNEGCQ
jgi:endoglucanase